MDRKMDLSGLDQANKSTTVLEAFARLPAGEAMELTDTVAGDALLSALQDTIWGVFDWYPLEIGPPSWRYALSRVKGQGEVRGVRDFLGTDHRRCDELFARMEESIQAKDGQEIAWFRSFELGMLHHFRMEEEGFFPAFEAKTGMRQGPTMVMRMEHEQMRGILKQMRDAADKGDSNMLRKAGNTLMMVIQQHNIKEEQMLYPMADMHMGRDIAPLLRELQRTP